MFQAIFDRMERKSEQRAEERARETITHAHSSDKEIDYERFGGGVSKEEERCRRAVNECFANDEHGTNSAGIEYRGANADHVDEIIRGKEHDGNDEPHACVMQFRAAQRRRPAAKDR